MDMVVFRNIISETCNLPQLIKDSQLIDQVGIFLIVVSLYLIVGIIMWTLSSSCAPRKTAVQMAIEAGIVLLGNGTEPSNLNPHGVSGLPAV